MIERWTGAGAAVSLRPMRLETELDLLAQQALTEALGLTEPAPALLRPTQDEKHGDYQVNGLMPLAKKLGKNPRELAELCAPKLRELEAVSSADVAGPGFVNLRISDAWLARRLTECLGDRERVVAINRNRNSITLGFEIQSNEIANVGFVVDDEYERRAVASGRGTRARIRRELRAVRDRFSRRRRFGRREGAKHRADPTPR